MKKVSVFIVMGVFLSLSIFSDAFCASSGGHAGGGQTSGGWHGGGQSSGAWHGGAYYGGGYRGGAYYGGGYRGYYGGGYHGYYGGWHGGGWGWYGFGPWWGYPYAYPYYYGYPYPYAYGYPYSYGYPSYPDTYAQQPVYVEPEQPSYWYFCQDAQAYYPYVQSCPGGWTRVAPVPPPQPGKEDVTP